MGNSRVTRRDLRREATKAAVLEAARKVFLAEGFDGATIKMIADEAGVSPGTVLNAESSKAALLVAILRNEYEAMAEACEQMEAALSGPAADRIGTLMHMLLDAHSRHAELFAAAIGHAWLVSDPTYQAAFERMEFAWASVRKVLREGVESGELRRDLDEDAAFCVLNDILLGALRQARKDSSVDPREALSVALNVVTEGLRAR
ncbi:MAG: TetR/AcrR family transcriptional regulator [Oceanicaulis sp.]